MLLILFNFIFNAYQLMWIYAFISVLIGYWENLSKPTDNILIILSCATLLLAILLGMMKLGEWWFRLFLNVRKTVSREQAQLAPLLQEVMTQADTIKGFSLKLHNPPKIMIIDEKEVNGMALGNNTIILSSGLLKTATNEEIKAVLAHELAHLYYRDGILAICLLFSSLPTALFIYLYSWYNRLSHLINPILPLNILWQLILFLAFLPILILEFIGCWLFKLTALYLSRRSEYRADQFAIRLGYKNALLTLLEKSEAVDEANNSLFSIMLSVHPSPISRIDKIETT